VAGGRGRGGSSHERGAHTGQEDEKRRREIAAEIQRHHHRMAREFQGIGYPVLIPEPALQVLLYHENHGQSPERVDIGYPFPHATLYRPLIRLNQPWSGL
jgi:hypothetical protein